jgi:L-cysteine S-thiosulfotransferase
MNKPLDRPLTPALSLWERVRVRVRALAPWLAALCITGATVQAQTDTRRSGFEFMSPATQAMQRDDTLNPGMLWVKQGEVLWHTASANNSKSCAGCHGEASTSMRGVAARYPAFDAGLQRPVNLAQRIKLCRQNHQQAEPWRAESPDLLSLESFVAYQSRGLPLAVGSDARLAPFVARGRQHYQQRMGQLDLSCAHCHEQRWGQHLGSSVIPQSHPTAYPVYRLEWQGLGSLLRRLRNCMSGVRAQPFALDSLELVELELYLASQAQGMAIESPGVRP